MSFYDIHFEQSQGVSAPNAAFLISVGGICNTVGRFVGGAISDLSWVQPLHLTCLTLAASLVSTFLYILHFGGNVRNWIFRNLEFSGKFLEFSRKILGFRESGWV